jgi:hypothetical protein
VIIKEYKHTRNFNKNQILDKNKKIDELNKKLIELTNKINLKDKKLVE